jgi:hypothetical protein
MGTMRTRPGGAAGASAAAGLRVPRWGLTVRHRAGPVRRWRVRRPVLGLVALVGAAGLGVAGAPAAGASPGVAGSAAVAADVAGHPWGSRLALAADASGPLEAFGTDSMDLVFHRAQAQPGNWGGAAWQPFDGSLRAVAAATNQNGLVELFGVNANGDIFHRVQTSPGVWAGSGWVQIPGSLTSIAAARDADGRLEIFGTNINDQIFHMQQTSPGNWAGANWQAYDGSLDQVAAATNQNGLMELFGVNVNGAIFRREQTSPGSWAGSGWVQIPGSLSSVAAARDADGRLEIFGTNVNDQIFHMQQTQPGDWTGATWQQDPGSLTQIAAATNQNGLMELFGINNIGSIYQRVQTTPGTWTGSNWAQLTDIPGPFGPLAAPSTTGTLPATPSSVTVTWYDTSSNERGFKVFKRDLNGNWQQVYQVPTRAMYGSSGSLPLYTYTWTDTSTDVSGQCYRVAAYNDTDIAYSHEECTVRPDPSQFPQHVPTADEQWSGLPSTNDGTGTLSNVGQDADLMYANQTFGVNLRWGNIYTSLWRIEAQGGPNLMMGQAVALKVWGGGWLKYGHENFGTDLQLSDTPVYEWHIIGTNDGSGNDSPLAGHPISCCNDFALWNSSAQAYLIRQGQAFGVDLGWDKPGGGGGGGGGGNPPPTAYSTYKVINCTGAEADTLEFWVRDLTTGSAWTDLGSQAPNWTSDGSCGTDLFDGSPFSFTVPTSGHYYEIAGVDTSPNFCPIDPEPDPNVASNCVRYDGTFLGSTTSNNVALYVAG